MIAVIGPEDLRHAVTWPQAVEAVRAALVGLSAGRVIQPPAVEIRMPEHGELHVKGGHIVGTDWIVIKTATGGFTDGAPTGCLLLLDAHSGEPRWLLDDHGWLTQQRTAAAGALATLTFSRPDSRTALVIGTGGLARAIIQAHQAVAPHLRLEVWGRDPDRASALASELGIGRAESLPDSVKTVDVIVTATNSRTPLFDAEWVQPGTHITGLGADTVGKQELPSALLETADLIVCDSVTTASYAGELQHATEPTRNRAREWAMLPIHASIPRKPGATTIADLCGIGAEDAAIAMAALTSLGNNSHRDES